MPVHLTSARLPHRQGSLYFQKTKIAIVKTGSMETAMLTFILIIILILFLAGTFLPIALEAFFSSDNLMEMGVYLEDFQPMTDSFRDQLNSLHSGPVCTCVGFSA